MRLSELNFATADDPDHHSHDAESALATIDSWLGVLMPMLPVPEAQRASIRDELESHLRDRVRDLTVAGCDEDEAVRIALTELGSATELAARFRDAHRYTKRRLAMNLGMIGLGLGVLGVGVITWTGAPGHQQYTVFQPQETPAEVDARLEQVIDLKVDEEPLANVIEGLADSIGMSIYVHWNHLNAERDTPVTLSLSRLPAHQVLELVRREVDEEGWLQWHYGENLVELGTEEVFARREMSLVCYDIRDILEYLTGEYGLVYDEAGRQVIGSIIEFSYPDYWHDMGGDLATHQRVGGKLFIEAPRRVHERVVWILNELRDDGSPIAHRSAEASADEALSRQ